MKQGDNVILIVVKLYCFLRIRSMPIGRNEQRINENKIKNQFMLEARQRGPGNRECCE